MYFPDRVRRLPKFDGPFDAFRLQAHACDVLFASYPAGTAITLHHHETENVGIITHGQLILTVNEDERRYSAGDWYHIPAKAAHSARFDTETSEIEFWFRDP